MTPTSFGARTIDEVHEHAILLWYQIKLKDPSQDPARGIFFALTEKVWPEGIPEVSNSIDLCSVLNQAFGLPPLSEQEKKTLNVKAFMLVNQHSTGGGPVGLSGSFMWANRGAFILAIVALLVSGPSWWVIGVACVLWYCYGASHMMAQKETRETSWELPVLVVFHLASLLALYVVSMFHLLAS